MCKKLIFTKNALFVNSSDFQFYLFPRKKYQIVLKIYTHTQKSIENIKITFLENVQKTKNIPIKDGGSPYECYY